MIKICSKCNLGFEASREFFFGFSRNQDGLRPDCKLCFRKSPSVKHKTAIKIGRGRPRFGGQTGTLKLSRKEINLRRYNIVKNDPIKKLILNCRTRTREALKGRSYKSDKTINLLGCSPQFLKYHLESKFEEGMNWGNHGTFGWHIDHIKPCASFDLTDPKQQKECFSWKNLQPLWWRENIKKGDKV